MGGLSQLAFGPVVGDLFLGVMREIITKTLVSLNGNVLIEGLGAQGDYTWVDDKLQFNFKLHINDTLQVFYAEREQFRVCIYHGPEIEEVVFIGINELAKGIFKGR